VSKLDKLRRDPALFFRDSRWPLVRRAGEIAAPLWTDRVREILLDPRRALAVDTVPVLSGVARILEDRAARDRRAVIEAAGTPQVSVIMAAKDAARTIDAAIASVVDQSHERLELIVIDDGSGDATRAAAERWASRDERIAVLANPASRGAAVARNRGLARAAGDFVAFQDADDVSDPERLERQIAPLLDGAAVMSVCNSARVDEAGERVAVNDRSVAKATISMVFRRAPVLERIGYLRPLRVSEDAEYYERIKAAFGPGAEVVIHTALLAQRFSPGSLLFSDGTTERDGDRVAHRRSAEADRAWSEAMAVIDRIRAGVEDPYVAFDPEASA
jgi:glycosyltransferase involved in cell wall biosynthesis